MKFVPTKRAQGFTLVELLVVVSIMAILTVAVVSAINPLEQLRKARDTQRKADAATLLAANDRFLATFGCYPWYWDTTDNSCSTTPIGGFNPSAVGGIAMTETAFTSAAMPAGFQFQLEDKEELKAQFKSRSTIQNSELYVFEDTDTGQLSVCFTPESKNARGGGLGPIMTKENTEPANPATACAADYSVTDANCNICVPQ